jgi:hypothetical protein
VITAVFGFPKYMAGENFTPAMIVTLSGSMGTLGIFRSLGTLFLSMLLFPEVMQA